MSAILTMSGATVSAAVLALNVRTWWKSKREFKDLTPFGGGLIQGASCTLCVGGLLGWVAVKAADAGTTAGDWGVNKATGQSGSATLAAGSMGTLTPAGACMVVGALVVGGVVFGCGQGGEKEDRRRGLRRYDADRYGGIRPGHAVAARRLQQPRRRRRRHAERVDAAVTVTDLFKKKTADAEAEETDAELVDVEDQEAGEEAAAEETELRAAMRELREAIAALTGRLWQGSLWLCQGCARGLTAWCQSGRRDDLDGPSAEYGVWIRGLALGAVAFGGWKLATAAPIVLVPAAGIWVLAAAYAKEPPTVEEEAPTEAEGETPAEPPVVALVRAQIGDEKGVHLRVLYPAMRASLPGAEEASDEALRQLLLDHQITISRSVRARGIAGRSGVYLKDLPSPLPKKVSRSGDSALSTGGDAGQGRGAESGGEARRGGGEGSERGGEAAARLVQDPENPARWNVVAS
ncbi:hypothetical protein [Streptomyces sp. NPDC102437]|uniref:hypothetical protein n=1 Tax=Streptomyces sp. NPDC102437 TaxID=3366175 RepID=UPI00381877CC